MQLPIIAVRVSGAEYYVYTVIESENIFGAQVLTLKKQTVTVLDESDTSVRMDTMMCSVPAGAQSTPAAIYENQFQNWQSGGTFHNFARIKFSAWMLFYLTAVIVLAGLLWWGIRRYCTWCKTIFEHSVNELHTQYLHTLWPRFVLRGIIVAVLGAGVIVALWCWLNLLVYPMEVLLHCTEQADIEHGVQPVLVLVQSAIHRFPVTELTLDDPEYLFHLAAHRGFTVFNGAFPINGVVTDSGNTVGGGG